MVVFLSKWDQIWVNLGSISENSPSISGGSPPGISEKTSPVLRVDIPRRGVLFGKIGVPFLGIVFFQKWSK